MTEIIIIIIIIIILLIYFSYEFGQKKCCKSLLHAVSRRKIERIWIDLYFLSSLHASLNGIHTPHGS